ncbi:MAG: hypothetical protein PHS36_07370, partial [Candidatus Cloacimonetes bacterium]|nr:hypothetical protein [Candidatus Cloacimonadota bacterium]
MLTHTKSSISFLAANFKTKADGHFCFGGDSPKKTEQLLQRLARSKNNIHSMIASLHESIGKQAFMAALFLISATFLLADYSVNESPNGPVCNPSYDQCELFSIVPATSSGVIVTNSIVDPAINATVIQNNGSIVFTIEDIAMSEHFAVSLDGTKIEDYTRDGWDISFTPNLMSGNHRIAGVYALADPSTIDWQLAFNDTFDVTSDDHYYQNSYAKIYPCTNGASDYGAIRPTLNVQDPLIQNNVISTTNSNGCSINSGSGYYPYSISYNIIHKTSLSGFNLNFSDPDEPRFTYQCDPELDSNYQPIWNATTMSPCIDAGIGEDEDGTPVDIGTIPAIAHRHWEYSFENQYDVDRWHWVSYPVLNTTTNNALIARKFFEELLAIHMNSNNSDTPTYLDTIRWVTGPEQDRHNIHWLENEYNWTPNQYSHFVSSPQGYKIKLQTHLNPEFAWPVTLKESGLKTPDSTIFPIYGGVENWLGYFRDDARMPQDAFADIWDDITMIKAKDWSLFRLPRPGNYWGMQGRVMPIKSGDMVIVRTNDYH